MNKIYIIIALLTSSILSAQNKKSITEKLNAVIQTHYTTQKKGILTNNTNSKKEKPPSKEVIKKNLLILKIQKKRFQTI